MNMINYLKTINNDIYVKSDNEHLKNEHLQYLNEGFNDTFGDYKITKVNGIEREVIVIDNEAYPHNKWFKCRPHEKLYVGDLVYLDGVYYLIQEANATNDKIQSSKAVECNWVIKWICPISHKILECPAYIQNSTKYNSGKYEAKFIDYGTSQVYVEVPANEQTIYIDTDMRFFLDKNKINPSVYEVTQVDHYTYNYQNRGICHISMSEDKYNPDKDNIDLMLPDYWVDKTKNISVLDKIKTIQPNDKIPTVNIEFIYEDNAEITVGFNKLFKIKCNRDDVRTHFNIYTVDNMFQDLIETTVNNNEIDIFISPVFDVELLPYPFVLQVLDEYNVLLKELNITIITM